ncbi:MAG TPA: SPFH domain-containing protein [Candidatus Paceibacterota bacterium]|nr:SPFH domain-containing protein [Candidatus Paceibacterota bacterium]
METYIIALLLIIIWVLRSYIIRALALLDIFYTFGKSNGIKYIEKGDILDHVIMEVPGYIVDQKTRLIEKSNGRTQQLSPRNRRLRDKYGIYYFGFYPFYRVRQFQITKQKENLRGTEPSNWMAPATTEIVDHLRFEAPRPYVFTDIEMKDRLTVHLKIIVQFQVVNAYIPLYVFNGNFFTQMGSLLESAVIDKLNDMTLGEFMSQNKGEVGGVLSHLKDPNGAFNEALIDLVGVMIISIAINDYQAGDNETVKAMQAVALAIEEGNAKVETAKKEKEAGIIKAELYKAKTDIETQADFDRQKKLAEAKGVEIKQLVDNFKGASTEVVNTTGRIMQAQAVRDSKLTTWVQNSDNAKPVIPTGTGTGGEQ